MCENTQSNERDFIRWFVPLTISNGPEFKVLESVFFLVWKLPTPLGETCSNSDSHSIEPPQQEGLPALPSTVSSLSILNKRWKECKLSRNMLKDFVLGEDPELFFKRRSDGGFTEDYGPICTTESWPSVSYSSEHRENVV